MKRIRLTLLGMILGGLTSTVSAQTVYSNMVGFQKVHVQQGQQVMASTPFDNVVSTISNAFSGQISPGVIDTAADNVLKWDASANKYRIFYQVDINGTPRRHQNGEYPARTANGPQPLPGGVLHR